MTKNEAIQTLQSTISTIKYFINQVQPIYDYYYRLYSKTKSEDWYKIQEDCSGFIKTANKYVSRYLSEINMYNNISDQRFYETFPSYTFKNIDKDLQSLKSTSEFLKNRYPVFS